MKRKRFVYMIINQNGQPLFSLFKERATIGYGMLWFFNTKAHAIEHIKKRNAMGFDLDKKRIIIKLDWKSIHSAGEVIWEQK